MSGKRHAEGPQEREANASLLTRPIIGGIFGAGRYALATSPEIVHGLHSVRFMILEQSTGRLLSSSDTKTGALNAARARLRLVGEPDGADGGFGVQGSLWSDDDLPTRPVVDRHRPVSKRRRVIFEQCQGRCHYCARPLTRDGTWHVEHMLPRALGGGDEPGNLVAACAPCNLAKRDRTALEFVAGAGK